jgi:aspartyl-tRNA(Asn)/glutamyl-tRNA(Gln) amidotransferase subunit B
MADASTPYRIKGDTGEWEVVIGLEVHAQVTSQAKLFSGAATAFGAEPNTQVSLVDAAMPGMLPVPNRECIRQAVRTGMAIDAQINRWSRFDRKNYFYADLPQGYQISQLYHPLVGEGSVEIEDGETVKTIGVERIHVEQDAGKLMHDQHPTRSYVDLNRSGVALIYESCELFCAMSAPAMATWKRVRCAPTSTSACGVRVPNSGPGPKPRTSIRSAS